MNIETLPNGNLLLIAEPDDTLEGDYWRIMSELFEPYSTNGSYTHFDASRGSPFVGLTDAPCIAECLDYSDEGDATIEGNFWYFADYMLVDDLEQLRVNGRVEYTLYKGE